MEITHYMASPLFRSDGTPWGIDSHARFASHPAPRGAVVFVHGFGGSALGTWHDFARLLSMEPRASDLDLIFFGYESRTRQLAFCAFVFQRFLDALLLKPSREIANPSLPDGVRRRDVHHRYSHVILCGHSLGAVVVRRALLDARSASGLKPLLSRVSIVLFAPADLGSMATGLIQYGLSGVGFSFGPMQLTGTLLSAWYRRRWPILDDLEPGSAALSRLERDAMAALSEDPSAARYLQAVVLHAEGDKVVKQNRFAHDGPPDFALGADHRSVCKPGPGYTKPLTFLVSQLP